LKISATIITLNEQENILAACQSVSWADEIVVVDSGSTDATCELAVSAGARVLSRTWSGFADQKQFAVDQARNDWIFSLDADERVSTELADSIRGIMFNELANPADGYRIPRRSFYMGRWIKAGGWYPDYQLRLFNRAHGSWKGAYVHESFAMSPDSKVKTLSGDILHFSVRNAAHHHRMIGERYAPLAARKMFEAGKRTSFAKLAMAGPTTFFRNFILKTGFRDGLPGFAIAAFSAHHAFLKHLLLYELQKRSESSDSKLPTTQAP
jgi:glycosyltransferase involved in cell wall biosynthesis